MTRLRVWQVVAALLAAGIVSAVVRNQIKVYQGRQARVAATAQQPAARLSREQLLLQRRQILFEMLQPVTVANCRLERFGESHDGGYLMCGNLLDEVAAGYSYGISGYDGWGCEVATRFAVPVHQYDCFNHTRPACATGDTRFHEECVGDHSFEADGRPFDTISNQIAKNGHGSRRVVLKMDVEGAEWDALYFAPDEVLERLDQLVVEFHLDQRADRLEIEKYVQVARRLAQFFHVAHIHYNNASCREGLEPFPAWAFEVLFVSKRLAVVDARGAPQLPHPLDAPNMEGLEDCQAAPSARTPAPSHP